MVSSIDGAVANVLQQHQQQVAKQRDEQRISEQRLESERQVQEEKRVQQTNNEQSEGKGSLVDITV